MFWDYLLAVAAQSQAMSLPLYSHCWRLDFLRRCYCRLFCKHESLNHFGCLGLAPQKIA